jgi:transposase-like protein
LSVFKTRELPSDAFVLYIDAYHCDIKEKNKIRKASVYVVLGIDLQGNKDIFGFYTFFSSENKADWIKVFNYKETLEIRWIKKIHKYLTKN